MYTIKDVENILSSIIISSTNIINQKVNDFEYQAKFITGSNTAFISISRKNWAKQLGKEPKIEEGNEQIKYFKHLPVLVITDEYISDLEQSISQIVVKDAVEAMQLMGRNFREHFSKPVIAITGSMDKSSTRIMIGEVLNHYQVLQNRGNANTRIPVLLNLCKLIQDPDFAVFEYR